MKKAKDKLYMQSLTTSFFSSPKLETFYFVLGCSWLKMLWFQVKSKGTQPYIHMYPFSPKLPLIQADT